MKALILVDIQNDFMPGGNLAVPEGDEVIAPANCLIEHFFSNDQFMVATQDWHPSSHGSFASNNNAEVMSMGKLGELDQVMWPDHCVEDSNGAEFHPDLDMHKVLWVVRKGIDPLVDSYSGFYDNAKVNDTGLHKLLQDNKVTEVYICGLAEDYCVAFTAIDAANLGYVTHLVTDATKAVGFPEGSVDTATQNMIAAGVRFVTVAEVLGE